MILQCQQCNARFLVPDAAIGPQGRNVRCGRCKHMWLQTPPQSISGGLSSLEEMLGDIETRPIAPGSGLPALQRPKASLLLKSATIAAITASAALALFTAKPALFGFKPSDGLVLADVAMEKKPGDRFTSYAITGNILNTSPGELATPIMRLSIVDNENYVLQYWDLSEKGKTLKPGESTHFDTGDIEMRFMLADRFVLELGNKLELAMRRKP